MTLSSRLLLGRLLTRSGDQAWDFAVPIVLLKIFPDHLRIAALYYLVVRLICVFVLPRLARLIDSWSRLESVRLGLGLQFFGVLLGASSICLMDPSSVVNHRFLDAEFIFYFTSLVVGGVLGSLGASFMDISIANDLVPSLFSGEALSKFNSRLRQVDLGTEMGSPVLAGLMIAISRPSFPLVGFLLIAAWNVISFFPEYILLRSIFKENPRLKDKPLQLLESVQTTFLSKLTRGWGAFLKVPVAPVMIAYALLWLSALSPHGVLLTGFLQAGWKLPEWIIGVFRGSGAIFGLAATVLFPMLVRRTFVARASFLFLSFQTASLLIACFFFLIGTFSSQLVFLGMILFSRIGLYGFSLGEMQLRQENIDPKERGRINGFAGSLTGLATLLLFGIGTLLPETQDFKYLIFLSTGCVALGLFVYGLWYRRLG